MKQTLRIAVSSAIAALVFSGGITVFAQAKAIWAVQPPITAAKNPAFAATSTAMASSTAMAASSTMMSAPMVGSIYIMNAFPQVVQAMTATSSMSASCPIVTGFMKMGSAGNTPAEVIKLQNFLTSQGFTVAASGIFDAQTEAAVESFQRKYMSEIMAPWGATRPSGAVYLTTANKINQLACGTQPALSQSDLSTINSYASATVAAQAQDSDGTVAPGMPGSSAPSAAAAGPTLDLSSGAADGSAMQQPGFYARFKNFVKSLFAR